jgi:hypothetical protein
MTDSDLQFELLSREGMQLLNGYETYATLRDSIKKHGLEPQLKDTVSSVEGYTYFADVTTPEGVCEGLEGLMSKIIERIKEWWARLKDFMRRFFFSREAAIKGFETDLKDLLAKIHEHSETDFKAAFELPEFKESVLKPRIGVHAEYLLAYKKILPFVEHAAANFHTIKSIRDIPEFANGTVNRVNDELLELLSRQVKPEPLTSLGDVVRILELCVASLHAIHIVHALYEKIEKDFDKEFTQVGAVMAAMDIDQGMETPAKAKQVVAMISVNSLKMIYRNFSDYTFTTSGMVRKDVTILLKSAQEASSKAQPQLPSGESLFDTMPELVDVGTEGWGSDIAAKLKEWWKKIMAWLTRVYDAIVGAFTTEVQNVNKQTEAIIADVNELKQ